MYSRKKERRKKEGKMQERKKEEPKPKKAHHVKLLDHFGASFSM